MNRTRALILATMATLAAACSLTPTQPTPVEAAHVISGNWVLTTNSQMGAEVADLTVKQTGNALAGTLTSPRGSFDYIGRVEGTAVAFSFTLEAAGNDFRIDYSGTIDGDTMRGKTVFGSFGEGTFTAKRKGS